MKRLIIALLLCLCVSPTMSEQSSNCGQKNPDHVLVNNAGMLKVLPNATVRVCADNKCMTPVAIYSDVVCTRAISYVTPDTSGNYSYFAPTGIYWEVITANGIKQFAQQVTVVAPGQKGDKGDTGPQGAQGQVGATGPAGAIPGATVDGGGNVTFQNNVSVPAGGKYYGDGSAMTGVLSANALSAAKVSTRRPLLQLYPDTWGFFRGVYPQAPPGSATWSNGEGSLTVTGTAGSGSLTVNSIAVGVLADYQGANDWAAVIKHSDGTYGVYSVQVSSVSAGSLTIYPRLTKSVTSGALYNLFNGVNGQHLTPHGYYAMADWLYALKKYDGYISTYAGMLDWDASGNKVGTSMSLVGGLTTGGYIPGTSIYRGYFENNLTITGSLGNASSPTDPNRTAIAHAQYSATVGAGTSGEGVQHTASLGGRSGYFTAIVGVSGQYSTTQNSAVTVSVVVDGVTIYSGSISGMTRISAPFQHGWNGTASFTLSSSAPTVFHVSRLGWFVWDDAKASEMMDSMLAPGSSVDLLMDSWGQFPCTAEPVCSNAFATELQALGAASPIGNWTGFWNGSLQGQSASWALSNYATLVTPHHPDYVLYDFQINDYNQSVTSAQFASNAAALGNLAASNGSTPIYLRSLHTASLAQTQSVATYNGALLSNISAATTPSIPTTALTSAQMPPGCNSGNYLLGNATCGTPTSSTPTTVPQWKTASLLFVANGSSGCSNANGCILVTKTDGSTTVVASAASTTSGALYLTPNPTNGMWLGGVRIVPTQQCSGATGLAVQYLGDLSALSKFASPAFSLMNAVATTNLYNLVPTIGGAVTNNAVLTQLNVSTGTVDQTTAGCAVNVYLLLSSVQ